MKAHNLVSLLACLAFAAAFSSCTSTKTAAEPAKAHTPFEEFIINTPEYPSTMVFYQDDELLKQHKSKDPIYISLQQQRGRLYVNGQVAMDWPVSTGVSGHATPTGKFHIVEKAREHSSGRYGHIYNSEGKCVKSNADSYKDSVPEGGRFVGAPMPNWMRLTSDGVGMHTGKVSPGRRLSHGCVRTPNRVASKLYSLTTVGTPTTIVSGVESVYPGHEAMAERAKKDGEEKAAREAAAQKLAEQQAKEEARKNRKGWF